MKTPKSAKKAVKAEALAAVETPVKTKTPKKPKTPKAEVAAAVATPKKEAAPKAVAPPKTPKTPKTEAVAKTPVVKPEKMEVSENGPKVNGKSKPAGFDGFGQPGGFGGFRRGSMRGGFRGGRGGFRGGRGQGVYRRDVNPKAIFIRFEDGITCDVAQALLNQFQDTEAVSFGRGFIVHFESEEAATELKEKAMSIDFGGVKPRQVENAYERVLHTEKRVIEGGEASPVKKQKVGENTKVEKKVKAEEEDEDEEEEEEEEEEGEEEEEEEGDEDDDDDDDDDEEEEDEDDEE